MTGVRTTKDKEYRSESKNNRGMLRQRRFLSIYLKQLFVFRECKLLSERNATSHFAAITFVWPENQTRSASELILPRERTTVISPAAAGVCNKADKAAEQARGSTDNLCLHAEQI